MLTGKRVGRGATTVLGAILAIGLLAACSGASASGQTGQKPAATSAAAKVSGTPVAVSLGETDTSHMFMKLDRDSVPAGPITFTVANDGVKVHEFVILGTDVAAKALKMNGDEANEDAYTGVDEAEDIQPGDTASLSVDLEPGHYALICNIEGHYRMGMFADLTVT